ncbi:conserved hypothetical protein [Desulfamplus magnetovallimortis]|uniref:Uncharacterized protein n=1 Tax=Desulfamplus magnetovallimortis TaxID=1246637 RepID=A0A1W1HC18_9BACT|nr:hypothetical protein [Desulfamplus magnetovallimortis]SLM30034.1 conserved hypothetical protein [Desulfamplus magnetovallimortis]
MTHEDAGHYAAKHPDRVVDQEIKKHLEKSSEDGLITCSGAHKVAKNIGITPEEAGVQIDLMELRLKDCCLGLFGYEPAGKNFDDNVEISSSFKDALEKISPDGRTTCLQCWKLAADLKIKRIDVGSACEKLGIKIKKCQLGAF